MYMHLFLAFGYLLVLPFETHALEGVNEDDGEQAGIIDRLKAIPGAVIEAPTGIRIKLPQMYANETVFGALRKVRGIVALEVSCANHITENGLNSIGEMEGLLSLKLGLAGQSLPSSFVAKLSTNQSLRRLSLRYCKLDEPCMVAIGKCTSVTHLEFRNVRGVELEPLRSLKNLNELVVSGYSLGFVRN